MNIQAPMQLFAYMSSVCVCDLSTVNNTLWVHTDCACAR